MSKKLRLKSRSIAFLLAAFVGIGSYQYIDTFAKEGQKVETSLSQTENTVVQNTETQNNERYLAYYFGINEVPEVISGAFFEEALNRVSDEALSELSNKEMISYADAVKLAVKAAHFEELALGYTNDKIKDKQLDESLAEQDAAYIACALDTGLINEKALSRMSSPISKEGATHLIMAVADANGNGRNFLGYTNEANIYGKITKACEEAALFENEKLQTIGEQAVMKGMTTGYNLINTHYSANFIPELTLRYGHSTTIHAAQLVGLLNSEGLVAKVQIEPKTSIFEYLPEWGDVPPATPDYKVEVVNEDLMLAYSLEYDLVFEFETVEDKIRFNNLVETYAKKNDENPEGEGLLLASWWQPLYVSNVEMGEGYKAIYNNKVIDGAYSLNPFCLPEDKEEVLKGLQAIDSSVEVSQEKIWCNNAFYRYLTGESHQ